MVLGYETALFLALELKYRQVAVLYVPPFELGFGILLSLSEDLF